MAKYIDRDSLIEWLKRIRLIDLSDGRGICRVIMEDDFKKAITNMPENIIVDVAPVVRCKDCKYSTLPSELTQRYGVPGTLTCHNRYYTCNRRNVGGNDFCSYGERKDDIEN